MFFNSYLFIHNNQVNSKLIGLSTLLLNEDTIDDDYLNPFYNHEELSNTIMMMY